jgi:hypothetical protein
MATPSRSIDQEIRRQRRDESRQPEPTDHHEPTALVVAVGKAARELPDEDRARFREALVTELDVADGDADR